MFTVSVCVFGATYNPVALPAQNKFRIAIDGPAGAGKTVAGRRLAARLGYKFLDTGLMYRLATVAALDAGASFDRPDDIADLVEGLDFQVLPADEGEPLVLIDGADVSGRLRTPAVDSHVSVVSAIPRVRKVMVKAQRATAERGGIVLTGRDIGTVVVPDAETKVFLTARPDTRAKRRFAENVDGPDTPDYASVLSGIRRRDEIDSSRADSPMRAATDAVIIETDDLTIEQVVDRLIEIIEDAD